MSGHSCRRVGLLCLILASVAPAEASASGDLDPTFGDEGFARFGFGHGRDHARALALAAGGKILVAGAAQDGEEEKSLVARYHADGSLDASFGRGGVVWIDNPGITEVTASVVTQPDGRIIVSEGTSFGSNPYWRAVRLLTDGSPDPGFGVDGVASIPFSGSAAPMAMALQADGKIVLAGYSRVASQEHLTVARLRVDGSLDPGFGGDGTVTVVQGSSSQAHAVGILNGKIVVAGYSVEPAGAGVFLAQLNDDGSLDAGFDVDGKVTTPAGPLAVAHALTFQTSAAAPPKILVAGETRALPGANAKFLVVRYLSNGSLDTSFDADGILIPSISGNHDRARGIRVRYSGGNPTHIVVAGTVDEANPFSPTFMAIAKLTLAGSFDPSFDGDGLSLDRIGGFRTTGDALLLPSGTVLCAGGTDTPEDASNFVIVRRNFSDGSHDTTFDGDGVRTDDLGVALAYCKDVVRQPDGRTLLAGYADGNGSRFVVSRLLPDGGLDGEFDGDGKATVWFGTDEETCRAIALQGDGRIVLAGNVSSTEPRVGLARLHSDGSSDATFGTGGTAWHVIGTNPSVTDVVVQPDGSILVTGYQNESPVIAFLARYLADGSVDLGFGSGGLLLFPQGWLLRSSALQPDGRIVVVGNEFVWGQVVRLLADGSADAGFGAGGVVSLPWANNSTVWLDVELLPDGRILVVGQEAWSGPNPLAIVGRYHSNGSPDVSLDGDGLARIPISVTAGTGTHAVATQADGRILISAKGYGGFDVLRLDSDGTPDVGYGSNGWANASDLDSAFQIGSASGIVIDATGGAVVVGTLGSRFAAARLLGDPASTSAPVVGPSGSRVITLRAHPNPTSGASVILLELPERRVGSVSVYDLSGRLVRRLGGVQAMPAGSREFPWDGRNESGASVAAGVYFVRAAVGEEAVGTRITVRR